MKKILFPLLFLFLLGCSKDENNDPLAGLPPETQTGANTFGCLIDGKLYLPRCYPPSLVFPEWGMMFWSGYPDYTYYRELEVRDLKSENGFHLLLHIDEFHQNREGIYIINESNGYGNIDGLDHTYLHCTIFDNKTSTYKKYISTQNSGILNIKYVYETPNTLIVSGIFNCEITNIIDPLDKIQITNGRFDIEASSLLYKEFP